jgi:DtxR family Mn-dependent transcriptional regulator
VPSLTVENYVKTIFLICAQDADHTAATGQIAVGLGVSPGTVTSMLKTLNDSGLAVYRKHEGVQLTPAGEALAVRMVRRHRLIELFLVRTLDMSWDAVHEEAEHIEHAMSDLLIDRIDAYLGYPAADPHGDPIPRADGTMQSPASRSLAQCRVGDTFRLVRVLDQSPEFLKYLTESGLQLGAEGSVVANSDQAGIVTVQIGRDKTTLGRDAAKKILVAP